MILLLLKLNCFLTSEVGISSVVKYCKYFIKKQNRGEAAAKQQHKQKREGKLREKEEIEKKKRKKEQEAREKESAKKLVDLKQNDKERTV